MADTGKIDLYQQHKDQYVQAKRPVLVTVGKATYLAIDGRGAPGGEVFSARVGALYAAAYTLKMTRKFAGQQDYTICKLEALWWLDGDSSDWASVPRDQWNWRLMIRTPDFIKQQELDKAVQVLLDKGKEPEVRQVRLEAMAEGRCVQVLHAGPYDQVGRTMTALCEFAQSQGLEFSGRHHEIYLSDPRRVAPERLKTIVREPVSSH
jgi:hypothetical protein